MTKATKGNRNGEGQVLEIRNLHVSIEADGKKILQGLDLTVRQGEIHAIMGPNGSGKSTMALAILGKSNYKVDSGDILLNGESIADLDTDKIAKKGIFLSMQSPIEIGGVTFSSFLRVAHAAMKGIKPLEVLDFRKLLEKRMKQLDFDSSFASRYINEGFSGGEKKRAEILQLSLFEPKFAILDETDSGLDVDALRTVAEGINKVAGPGVGIIIITHYSRILRYIKPDFVHVLAGGRIIKSGGADLAHKIEEKGYGWVKSEVAAKNSGS
ncbi:Fe-S cluster assembly ATPase SufC [Candidatus Parvarchaeota archaeon]|nr:Fe-S cluster assembly ATPase SufC [Candidatus Parvarchaeota archaeon]